MSDMTADQVLNQARRIADEVLFPSALIVDSADRVPAAHFDVLAAARLYGLRQARCQRADSMPIWPRSAV